MSKFDNRFYLDIDSNGFNISDINTTVSACLEATKMMLGGPSGALAVKYNSKIHHH